MVMLKCVPKVASDVVFLSGDEAIYVGGMRRQVGGGTAMIAIT
jgi:hypothetical protein